MLPKISQNAGIPTRLDQTGAPLLEAVRAYRDVAMLPFTIPGHKCGRGIASDTAAAPGLSGPALRWPYDLAALATEAELTPRDAVFAPARRLPLARSCGEIAAEMLTPYPPGIPVLAPGERITRPIVEYLRAGVAGGMHITGASDPSLATVRVVGRTS